MALTNSEKQRRYQQRMVEKGFKRVALYMPLAMAEQVRPLERAMIKGQFVMEGFVVRDTDTGRVRTISLRRY